MKYARKFGELELFVFPIRRTVKEKKKKIIEITMMI